MDYIYFFSDEFIEQHKENIKQCSCDIPGCSLLLYTNAKKDNVVHINFKEKKKIV